MSCPSTVIDVGANLASVLIALVGMIGSALAGYGYHSVTNGGSK